MSSIDVESSPPVNGVPRSPIKTEDTSNNIKRLQNLVHNLEVDNDLPSPTKVKEFLGTKNGTSNTSNTDPYSLENTTAVSEFECDTDLDSEDSWLYESPQKIKTPGQPSSCPEKWLKSNTSTPELMRVRGSLSAKLDVIAIENRKGRMSNNDYVDSKQRRRSKGRAESMNSVNSLDWDYDEDQNRSKHKIDLSNEDVVSGLDYDNDFDPESELALSRDLERGRQAWSEPVGRPRVDPNDSRPFSLDWSDGEDELVPMKIDFNAIPQGAVQRRMPASNGTIIKRSGSSGISSLATPRQGENYDYDDLVAKPQGGVKARRVVQPVARMPQPTAMSYDDEEDIIDYGQDDIDDLAPVVPRGSVKPRASKSNSKKKKKKTSFAESILIHPIEKDEEFHEDYDVDDTPPSKRPAPSKRPPTQQRSFNDIQSPSQRGPAGIAKPVQRRKPGGDSSGDLAPVRVRSAASSNNAMRPRGSAQPTSKSASSSDILADSSLKAKLPSGGDGAVLRRRGAPTPSDEAPTVRKSKESPQIARVQGGLPQVRKSTGSIPQKSGGSNLARPRGSQGPSSGMVRPRGSGMTSQSYQA